MGIKPSVAFINQKRAKENIDKKILALKTLLGGNNELRVVPVELSDITGLPDSVRKFNLWKSDDLSKAVQALVPAFIKNSPDTLRADALRTNIVAGLVSIKVEGRAKSNEVKQSSMAELRRRLKTENLLRNIAEQALMAERICGLELRKDLEMERLRIKSLETEANEMIALKDKTIRELIKSANKGVLTSMRLGKK